jgi:hypothetical protein
VSAFPIGAGATLAELEQDPHELLARLRGHEPVSWLPALDSWLVTRREDALRVLRDAETFTVDDERFSTGKVVGPSMLTLDGRAHGEQRAPFADPFRKQAVRRRFTDTVRIEADRLIDRIAPDGAAELRRALAGPLAARTVTRALGLETAGAAVVLGWYEAIVESVNQITAGRPPTDAGASAFAQLRDRTEAVLAGDGASLLGAASDSLPVERIVSNAAVMLFGGIETTEGMIANAVLHLLAAPQQLALVRAEPRLIAAAIEESLRLEPAAAVLDRYATIDVQLGHATVRRGDAVRVSIAAANRDPAMFADPDRFEVHRANAARHLAFAHGPHVCIGMHLARLEAHTALERLLARLPGLRLDPQRPPPQVRGLVFRKPPALHVVWD